MNAPAESESKVGPDPVAKEQEALKERRALAGVPPGAGVWALALSGGGVRSATICLGLLRGLARTGLLHRFDYLSTVSGGGYIGASFGRLFSAKVTPAAVERGVASDDSTWLWWLRNNGRYLTPAGAKDLGVATASIVRGVIATHLEIGVLLLLLAAIVTLPHLVTSLELPTSVNPRGIHRVLSNVGSAWWWLLPLPIFALAHQLFAYWFVRDDQTPWSRLLVALVAIGSVPFATFLLWWGLRLNVRQVPMTAIVGLCVFAVVVIAMASAWLESLVESARHMTTAKRRLAHTRRASYCLWAILVFALVGALEWAAWWLTGKFWNPASTFPFKSTAVIAIALALGRILLPEIQRWQATTKQPAVNVEKVLNLLGLLLAALVAVFWTTVFTAIVFNPAAQAWTPDQPLQHAPQLWLWLGLVVACLVYVLVTRKSFDLLNLASLHNFYRARIERAYVSSGNCGAAPARFPGNCPLDRVTPAAMMAVAPLTEAIPGDDIAIDDYQPHAHGGPIHLVNCCINQSIDDLTGIYNADRKGVALTIGPFGPETAQAFAKNAYGKDAGTLSRWIAISGAAASTGMGSRTSPGFAGLLFMSGLRLGFWTRSLISRGTQQLVGQAKRNEARDWLLRHFPKPFAIVGESIARFPGLFSPIWYVSDGGHFDNTGIHALLKRRPSVIVAADCGADPKYLFSDLESLVRKAKIDYGATIEFLDEDRIVSKLDAELHSAIGTPERIGPDAGTEWLVLGRICYAGGERGTLLVVKPRRIDEMPFDIVAYADRNHDFPQQTTGDQFFDEAQWEAYHQLGLLLGSRITPSMVHGAERLTEALESAPSSLVHAELQARAQAESSGQVVARRDRAVTVRASLGAGISLSVLLAGWQVIDQFREKRRTEDEEYQKRVAVLEEKVRKAPLADLLPSELERSRSASAARKDHAFDSLMNQLSVRCRTLLDAGNLAEGRTCQALQQYSKVETKPYYDYWFADRIPTVEAATLVAAAAAPAPAAVPASTATLSTESIASVASPATSAAPDVDVEPAPAPPPPPPPLPVELPPLIAQAPAVQAPVTQTPVTQAPVTQAPVAQAPVTQTPVTQAPVTQAPAAHVCTRARVFLHIYDEESRRDAERIGIELRASRLFDASPIENVVATATRHKRQPPIAWKTAGMVVHPGVGDACIEAVRARMPDDTQVHVLPSRFKPNPGMIELWLPPRTSTA